MIHTRWLTTMSKIHRSLSRLPRFGEPGLNGVTRGSIGMNVSWGRSLPHTYTRAGSHTHVRGRVCRDGNPVNARLNHCHLTDWPVSMVLVKKKSRQCWLVASRLFRAWMNIHLYFTAEIAKSRNERCAREREFNSLLREFEKIISFLEDTYD